MAITTVDDIAAGLANNAQQISFLKTTTAAKAAGAFQSCWKAVGWPVAGNDPPAYTAGGGYTCDKDTPGALPLVNAAVQNYLAKLLASSVITGNLIIADRLWSCSGMGFAIGTYTVTTPGDLPARIVDYGVGCELWVEQFAAAGSASGTLTCAYKNPANGDESGVLSAVVSAPVTGQMQQVPLQAGSTGIRQLVSATNSNTWTSGSWGMTILKRLAVISLNQAAAGYTLDWASIGLPKISNNACLMLIFQDSATTLTTLMGQLILIDK